MTQMSNPSFQFYNTVSPRYLEPLFIQLSFGQEYSTAQFTGLLHSNGLDVKGNGIALHNMLTWSLAGLGQIEKRGTRHIKKNIFWLTELGKQLVDTYSTNSELFYDLMHFLFYSTYHRSNDVRRGRFWLYASVCDRLWQEAPAPTDISTLTNRLQIEIRVAFPGYDSSFSERSVGGVFSWLQTLVPPFLSKQGTQLFSARRSYCTPQLFHLATALIYTTVEGLQYGASLAVNERHIEAICKVCLLHTEHFWYMADLTRMTVNGYEMRRGQWGTSIALEGPPAWITLPDFSNEKAQENISEFGGEE
ncbi:MAG: hypothetical protein ACJ8DI_14675 [Ktedonobacteraceae bacterium]